MNDRLDTDLVLRARSGDQSAWNELVERFSPLLWSVCRRYRLSETDANDVGQSVWLRLVEHLPAIREPSALPGWLATTTARECLRVLRTSDHELSTLEDFTLSDAEAVATINSVATVTDVRRILHALAKSQDETLFRIVTHMLNQIQTTGEVPSSRQIAGACGLSHTGVAKALTRLQPYFADLQSA